MAEVKVEQLGHGTPVVQAYEIEDDAWNFLHVLRFDSYSEDWAKFILQNRNNPKETSTHDYDVVIGPIANDRVGLQLWKYESNMIDLPILVHNLQYMKGITIQYFFLHRTFSGIFEKNMMEKISMKADMVKNLALLLLEKHADWTMEQALSAVFNSDTYQKVMNEQTHLYYQSPRYVFSFLEEELRTGKFS